MNMCEVPQVIPHETFHIALLIFRNSTQPSEHLQYIWVEH